MHRFLVRTEELCRETVVLAGETARHLKVVRPKPGELVELFDGKGGARSYKVGGGGALASLAAAGELRHCPPSPFVLTLFACVTKGSRWDWTIEKAVELGVSRIVPVISDRCIVRLAASERDAKAERWRRIAADAARQSDAVWLPEVFRALDFRDALEEMRNSGTVFAGALTDPPPQPLWTALAAATAGVKECRLGLFVGPEGDFSPDELRALLDIATPVSLGPTILRAETAAIFGLSVLAAAAHAIA
jgi:16S rRNA (uracil1498-N3)-methyltransferase